MVSKTHTGTVWQWHTRTPTRAHSRTHAFTDVHYTIIVFLFYTLDQDYIGYRLYLYINSRVVNDTLNKYWRYRYRFSP